MVTTIILLDWHTTVLTRTMLCRVLDLLGAGVILNLALTVLTLVILFASLSHMECFVVRSADEKVAGCAAEDVTLHSAVVDLAGIAAWT
jgi:hypothetical protein